MADELNPQLNLDTSKSEERLARLTALVKSLVFAVDQIKGIDLGGAAFEQRFQKFKDLQKLLSVMKGDIADITLRQQAVRNTVAGIRSSDNSSAAAISRAQRQDALAAAQYNEDQKLLRLTKLKNAAFEKEVAAVEKQVRETITAGQTISGELKRAVRNIVQAQTARLGNQLNFQSDLKLKPGSREAADQYQQDMFGRVSGLQDTVNNTRRLVLEQKQAAREVQKVWENLVTGVQDAVQASTRVAMTNLANGLKDAVKAQGAAIRESRQAWANLGKGVEQAAKTDVQVSMTNLANGLRDAVKAQQDADKEKIAGEKLSRSERLRNAQESFRDLKKVEAEDLAWHRDYNAAKAEMDRRDAARAKQTQRETDAANKKAQRDADAAARQAKRNADEAQRQASRDFRASPEGQQQRIQDDRDRTLDKISGLGGLAYLFRIQTQLALNYKILSTVTDAFRDGARFVKEFDDNLHKLQAIAALTNPEIASLRENLMDAAEGSRFTANELAKASVLLAQAGLSAEQIGQVLKPITQLAQATGSDVAKVVDVFTSIIGVFNIRATEAVDVANQISAALNVSKLDIDKFALAMQYAGTTAAEANISFSEFAAVIAKVSNAGVRSGSTLGTGSARLITELVAPSDKLIKALKQVGLTEDDVNVRTKGLVAVLETLKSAGFGAEQAFGSLDQRSARFLLSVNSSSQSLIELQRQILFSDAATQGSATATKSLAGQLDVLAANAGNFASKQSKDLVSALTLITEKAAGAFSWLSKMSDSLNSKGLSGSRSLGGRFLDFAISPITGGPLAQLFSAIQEYNELTDPNRRADRAAAQANAATQEYTKQREAVDAVDRSIGSLNDRYKFLNTNQDALKLEIQQLNKQFADMGFSLDTGTSKIEDVISALIRLKQQASGDIQVRLAVESKAIGVQQNANSALFKDQLKAAPLTLRRRSALDRLIGGEGQIVPSELGDQFHNVLLDLNKLNDVSAVAGDDKLVQRMRTLLATAINRRSQLVGQRGTQGVDADKLEGEIEQVSQIRDHLTTILNTVTSQVALAAKAEVNLRQQAQASAKQSPLVVAFEQRLTEYEREQQAMRQELEKAPIDKKEAIVKRLQESRQRFAVLQQNFTDSLFASLADMDPKDVQAVVDELNNKAGATNARTTGVVSRGIEAIANLSRQTTSILISTIEVDISRVQKELDKAVGRPTTTDSQIDQLEAQLRELDKQRAIVRRKDLERQKAQAGSEEERQILDRLEEQKAAAEERATTDRISEARIRMSKTRIEEQQKLLEYQDAQLSAEVEALKAQLTGPLGKRRSAQDKKQILQQIYDLMFDQMVIAMTKAINDFLQSSGLNEFALDDEGKPVTGSIPQSVLQSIRAIYDKFRAAKQKITTGQDNRDASAGIQALSEELRAKLKQLQIEFKSVGDAIERINKVFEEANREADRIITRFETRQQAMLEPQNRNNFSSVNQDASAIRNRPALERRALEAQVAAARQRQADTEAQLARLRSGLATSGALVDREAGGLRGFDKDNPDPNQTLTPALTQALAKYQQFKDEIKQTTVAQTANGQALADLIDRLQILSQVLPAPTMLQQIADGFTVWADRVGALKTFTAQLGQAVPEIMDNVASSIGDALDSISFKTKSVGAAFADMARNILKSMISLLNQIAARSALGFLTQMLGGLFGSGSFSSTTGFDVGAVIPKMTLGGMVRPLRRAGGGGIPGTRDSVLTYLTPGEGVVNTTAMQALGEDTLNQINAMGNRRVSRAPRPVMPVAPSAGRPLNIWMVSPDQVPPPSENDIIHAVGRDMRNGGTLKVLVKQIQQGQV